MSKQTKDEFYLIFTFVTDFLITKTIAAISPAIPPITTSAIRKLGRANTRYCVKTPIPAPVSSINGHIVPFSSGHEMVKLIFSFKFNYMNKKKIT